MKLTENQMYALAALVLGGVLFMYYKKAKGTMPTTDSVLPTQTKPDAVYGSGNAGFN
jgi:hypothetical protein